MDYSTANFVSEFSKELTLIDMTRSHFIRNLARTDEDVTVGAIHEAGHCVVAWALGFQVTRMCISESIPDPDGIPQKSSSYQADEKMAADAPVVTRVRFSMAAMAGFLAEMRITDTLDENVFEGDFEKAIDRVRNIAGSGEESDDFYEMLIEDTNLLLDEHWDRVEWLAIAAMQLGPELSGQQIVEVIESV